MRSLMSLEIQTMECETFSRSEKNVLPIGGIVREELTFVFESAWNV
jgi:hypothetical protein